MNWWNDYIGIQYKTKGRDRSGLDCWGLVRLVYDEQYGIKLPSFDDGYNHKEHTKQEELIALHKEGWDKTLTPKTGDVVLFRIAGSESHVGIITTPGHFLHCREGQDSVIERLDSAVWKHRVVGTFRYRENGMPITISACPHPLKQTRVDTAMPSGLSLGTMSRVLRDEFKIAGELDNAIIAVDGEYIAKERWETYIPMSGAVVEYRAVPTGGGSGGIIKIVAMVAVIAIATIATAGIAGAVAATAWGAGATMFMGAGLSFAGLAVTAFAGAAISMAGMALVNAIFPTRQPSLNGSMSGSSSVQSPVPMNTLNGGRNENRIYGSIPVVLGKCRWTPPIGASTYVESSGTNSFLRMLLVWGYGPLQVSDLRIGENAISTFNDVEVATLQGLSSEDKTDFNRLYGKDVDYQNFDVQLKGPDEDESDRWVSATFSECDQIKLSLTFPNGLRRIQTNYGKTNEQTFRATVQARQLDSETLAPLTGWGDIQLSIPAYAFTLKTAWFNVDSDEELEPVYQLTRVSCDEHNKIIVRRGAMSKTNGSNPTGSLLSRLQEDNFGINVDYSFSPAYGSGEESLWDIIMYGNDVISVTDRRGATGGLSVTGCGYSRSGYDVTITSGTITRAVDDTIKIGGIGEKYCKRKDAFAYQMAFNVTRGAYEVRIRCTSKTDTNKEVYTSGAPGVRYATCALQSIAGFKNARPVTPPKPLAMSAMRIRATDQLNGNLEGVSGNCTSICLDWDRTTSTWVSRPTRNPASLFRYVLQHPANAKRVSDSQIDLDELVVWHNYCRTNKFMFDMVLTGTESVLDVLRDIAAAGRSSPLMKDGKWTIVTDKPRSSYAQYFTPHNSWGFEGNRILPKMPHGFRIQFSNSQKGYEPDEMIVYNDGYSAANATVLEGLSLPGVTTKDAIFKHARFHLAQLKLRPETYTLNVDIEHIVCNRGDLVKVTHDVPMWGLGTGRIVNRISSTQLELDEAMPMDAGVQYTIRIRLEDGTSITRTVAAKATDGYYTTIELTSSVTTTQAAANNLFMFGALSEESVDCIVQSIEPMDNMTARLVLVDYSPAIYDSDDEPIPAFDSQITKPPILLEEKITEKPTITGAISNETMMVRLGPGIYQYGVRVSYSNPTGLQSKITHVQGEIDSSDSIGDVWQNPVTTKITTRSITFNDVEEGDTYKIRLRYVDEQGRVGPWSSSYTTTIQGRVNPPPTPANLVITPSSSRLLLDWDKSDAPDVELYEVRLADSNWGSSTGRVFRGAATTCYYVPSTIGTYTFYVKAIDSANNYSTTALSGSYAYGVPANPASLTYTIHDTSTTTSTITLDWSDVAPAFGLKDYVISYGSTTVYANASTITLPANWIGDRTFTVKTRDVQGNVSSGVTLTVTKLLPNTPASGTSRVDNGALFIDWVDAVKTTLPVWGYEVRKNTAFGGSGFVFKGAASQCSVDVPTLVVGINTFYIKTIDTDGNYSADYLTINHNYYQVNDISTLTHVFADTALTNATITFDWNDVKPQYGLAYYEVSYDSVVRNVNASTITLPADWLGSRNFTIKVVDVNGNKSSGYTTSITKLVPNAPINFRASVIDNNVMLYWTLPAKTTLPISHALLKKGASWAAGELVGEKAGEFTTINETRGGTYTYWLAMVDTDGNQSTPVSVTAKVSEPPDFVFHGSQDSTFSGTKSSALLEDGVLVMPVNLTETFEQHFTTRGWSTPQDQITAGYPIYIQPTNLTGYYRETFDFGTILASSKVTVSYGAYTLNGSPTIVTKIETSDDNVTWVVNDAVTEVFATNFRYVRVTITVSGTDDLVMWLTSLNVRCDAKQITDAGSASAVSTDANGTIVNFNKSFIDVDAITLTPSATTPVTAVYDFQDAVLSGTYSVTSNVITVNVTGHGLIAGQKVRLGVSTGTAPSTVVTISTAATNSFTAALTTGNTSGNLSIYPEGFRVYLFNSAGTRVSGTVSWNVRGY